MGKKNRKIIFYSLFLMQDFLFFYRFRDCVTWLQKKYFAKSEDRPEFFPVEWRSALKLDGGKN